VKWTYKAEVFVFKTEQPLEGG